MKSKQHAHYFSNWATERLEEIESTVKTIEAHVGALHTERKHQAEKTLSDIRAQCDAFRKAVREQTHEGEAVLAAAKAELAPAWATFEATVQKYLTEVGHTQQQQQETFKARAEAQRKAWQQTIDTLRADAASFAQAKKQDADKVLEHLKAEAESEKSKLERQQRAGGRSWAALQKALEESRAAFDKASHKAFEAFKKAA